MPILFRPPPAAIPATRPGTWGSLWLNITTLAMSSVSAMKAFTASTESHGKVQDPWLTTRVAGRSAAILLMCCWTSLVFQAIWSILGRPSPPLTTSTPTPVRASTRSLSAPIIRSMFSSRTQGRGSFGEKTPTFNPTPSVAASPLGASARMACGALSGTSMRCC